MTDVSAAAQTVAEGLGLRGEEGFYGPGRHIPIKPSQEADDLAVRLAHASLKPLRSALAVERCPDIVVWDVAGDSEEHPRLRGAKWTPTAEAVPETLNLDACALGLPLTLSVCPELQSEVVIFIVHRLTPSQNPQRATRRELGMRLVAAESHLWDLAAKHGGPSPTIPYASRLRALRWFWEPGSVMTPSLSLCVRCGFLEPIIRDRRLAAPVCSYCRRDPSLERANAVAPAERGTWWLRCAVAECSAVFAGRPQARRCPPHRTSRITPRRRAGVPTWKR